MTDYTKAKIYKIEALNSDDGDIYIGSTCKTTLAGRMTKHRTSYRCWLKDNKYSHIRSYDIFDKYGLENCHIYLLENYPCTNRDELRAREGYYIKNNACVNKQIAGRTLKEYRDDHKAEIKEYRDNHKAEEKKYRECHKAEKKEYRECHKAEIKQYYQDHKTKINKRNNTPFKCICGGCYSHVNIIRHNKTIKHINFISKMDNLFEEIDELLADLEKMKPLKLIHKLEIPLDS